ncbi:MAG: fasciclin domain-containing protein [Flavobacteriales bacterium]|nr:fasciclin domain-containing protein [Flavobacteriales bacterium]
MTRIITTLSFCACILFSACSSIDSKDTATPLPSTDKTETPEGLKNLSEAEKRGMRLLKRRQDEKNNTAQVKEKNLSSVYKYLTTSDEYPIFTTLMRKSAISKHIHSHSVTVLAPVDKAFDIFPEYKYLLRPENEELLNAFISYHVVDSAYDYKEFADHSQLTVHSGESLELTNRDGIHFNGAHVRSGSINTNLGSIIGMDDLIFYPKLTK